MDEITIKLKERFCKDNNLSIKIFQEPYFMDRLKLYDKQFDTLSKWNLFLSEIEEFKTEQEYFSYYNETKEKIINFIKNTNGYKEFNSFDPNKYSVKTYGIPSSNIFHENNNGKSFISIDLKKGCYSAMRFFDKSIINNTDSYESFIGQFTDKKHIINSKYIRQVIFGNCDCKRQGVIEKYMMGLMMEEFQKLDLNFAGYTNDEIVIHYDEKAKKTFDKIKEIVYTITKKYDFDVHFDVFNIERVKNTDVYIKNFLDKKDPEIKCANHLIMPFILRMLNHENPQPNDFIFYENGNLAALLEVKELQLSNETIDAKINKYRNYPEEKINQIEQTKDR